MLQRDPTIISLSSAQRTQVCHVFACSDIRHNGDVLEGQFGDSWEPLGTVESVTRPGLKITTGTHERGQDDEFQRLLRPAARQLAMKAARKHDYIALFGADATGCKVDGRFLVFANGSMCDCQEHEYAVAALDVWREQIESQKVVR